MITEIEVIDKSNLKKIPAIIDKLDKLDIANVELNLVKEHCKYSHLLTLVSAKLKELEKNEIFYTPNELNSKMEELNNLVKD